MLSSSLLPEAVKQLFRGEKKVEEVFNPEGFSFDCLDRRVKFLVRAGGSVTIEVYAVIHSCIDAIAYAPNAFGKWIDSLEHHDSLT